MSNDTRHPLLALTTIERAPAVTSEGPRVVEARREAATELAVAVKAPASDQRMRSALKRAAAIVHKRTFAPLCRAIFDDSEECTRL
jgi:hypothetical protein